MRLKSDPEQTRSRTKNVDAYFLKNKSTFDHSMGVVPASFDISDNHKTSDKRTSVWVLLIFVNSSGNGPELMTTLR